MVRTLGIVALPCAAWSVSALSSLADEPKAGQPDLFSPAQAIFVEHCYQCHGPDKQESGLRLDQRAAAIKGGDSGAAWVAGKSGESELLRRVSSTDDDTRMPPPGAANKPLSTEQVRTLRTWIDQGATWPEAAGGASTHWAYQPIHVPMLPAVKNEAWVANPIDRFVLAPLEARSIAPSPAADRYTLAKRLWYDLLGLPPETREVDAFVSDTSPDAYQRLVDRLLDSPHFGERWGRHWLDMARYADSDGYEKDNPRPDAWRYRDWVIGAVNADLPLDQFTVEQLAGDLLPGATPEQRLATAFHRQTLTNTEGGADQEQFRVEAIFDRVATTGSVWLGLTVGCAQCHTHKYDAITHEEFYKLFAFFNNADEVEADVPLVGEALANWAKDRDDARHKLEKLEPKLAGTRQALIDSLPAWEAELKKPAAAPVEFVPVELLEAKSSAGAEIKLLSDGSYLVTGKNPDVDKITIKAKSDLPRITGFRVETLPHPSLGGNGPGRTPHGNFVLSEFRAFAAAGAEITKDHRVDLSRAEADYSQATFPPAAALDGKEQTGWAIGSQEGRNHQITIVTKKPIDGTATPYLQLVLSQNHGSQHTIGRFRIMAMTGDDPLFGVPQHVRDILAVTAEKRTPEEATALIDYRIDQDDKARELAEDVKKQQRRLAATPTMRARVLAERGDKRRTSHILHRGDFLQPDAEVSPGTLASLPALAPRGAAPDRLDLARWLVSSQNPLTPRVTVNHLWSNLFGRGLVRTANDFGVRGERPTHPELLDWLAGELVRRRWSRKDMIRLIVSSATYQQSSRHRPDLADIDPQNHRFYRQNRWRVEAEVVRDLTLAAGGLLCDRVGGPSVFPPLAPDIAALSYANNFKWKDSAGDDRYRRGMYTFFKRTAPHPNLTTFDCPDANTTSIGRRTSNTPLQALVTLNNESFVEAAQSFAKRLLESPAVDDRARLTVALRDCLTRPPTADELSTLSELLSSARAWYAAHADEAKAAVGPFAPKDVPSAEAAAWVATVRIMLNLDEFLTRE